MRCIEIRSDAKIAEITGGDSEIVARINEDRKDMVALEEIARKIRNLSDMPAALKLKLCQLFALTGVSLSDYAARLPICAEGLLYTAVPAMEKNPQAREIIAAEYKKYELLPLPKYYEWKCPDGII
jgi:hypothetical protein